MKISIDKANQIISSCKRLISLQNDLDKNSVKSADFEISERARGKARENANYSAHNIEKEMHELHCLSVEFGASDIREDKYYGERIMKPNGWHELRVTFRKPNL
jgi:hypothetical protein